MKASEAKELFRQIAKGFFRNYTVIFSKQSRTPKPQVPLVTLSPGNVSRPQSANYEIQDGEPIGHYLSRLTIVVDLFTNGEPITENGTIVAYENIAMDEILAFADYINSIKTVDFCHQHDVSLLIDGDAEDLTGIVNDTNYEYRSRLRVQMYFTQDTASTIGIENVGSFSDEDIHWTED